MTDPTSASAYGQGEPTFASYAMPWPYAGYGEAFGEDVRALGDERQVRQIEGDEC
jgi:hypothetical protein